MFNSVKNPSGVSNLFIKFIFVLTLVFLFAIVIGQSLCTANMDWAFGTVSYGFNLLHSGFLFFLVVLCTFNLLKHKHFVIKGQYLFYLSCILITVISLYFIFSFNPKLSVDAEEVMGVAKNWLQTGSVEGWYLKIHPYQLGLISLLKGMLNVFGDESLVILFFRLVNIIALIIINSVIFLIGKKITNEQNAEIASIIFSLLLFPQMLTTYVYGDLIGYAFAFVSVWCCLSNVESFKPTTFVSQLLTLLLAIYFRLPTFIIGIAELIIMMIYFNKFKLISITTLFIVLIIGNNLGELILEHFYHFPTTNIPFIARIAMSFDYYGMGIREPGWNTSFALDITGKCSGDVNCIKSSSFEYLIEVFQLFFKQPKIGINYLLRKFYSQWLIPDFEGFSLLRVNDFTQHSFFWFGNLADSYFIYITSIWMKGLFTFVAFTSCLAIFKNFNTNNTLIFALALVLCGCFGFYTIGEVKARYVIPFVFFMIPLMSLWFDTETTFLNESIRKKKNTILIFVTGLFAIKGAIEFQRTELPVTYKQSFTDTTVMEPLLKDRYYQIPFDVVDNLELDSVSLYLSVDKYLDNTYLQVDILDKNKTIIASGTSGFDFQEIGYVWKEISVKGSLEPGSYYIQINSSNVDEIGLNLILGEQYSFVDQENLLMNGFQTELKANYKIYKNHY